MKRLPLIAGILFFIVLCLSGSYWVMKLIKPEVRKFRPPQFNRPSADVESVASLFGGVMVVDVNYQLKGIVQANPMNQSVAIISTDGAPPKAYTIHSEVNSGSSLNEVFGRYVLLKENGTTKRIELPQESDSGQITMVSRSPNPSAESRRPTRRPVQFPPPPVRASKRSSAPPSGAEDGGGPVPPPDNPDDRMQ